MKRKVAVLMFLCAAYFVMPSLRVASAEETNSSCDNGGSDYCKGLAAAHCSGNVTASCCCGYSHEDYPGQNGNANYCSFTCQGGTDYCSSDRCAAMVTE